MGTLFAIGSFGSWFSTMSLLVIVFDIYVLLKFGSVNSLITTVTNDIIGITGKILYDIVPKYKDDGEKYIEMQSKPE